MMKRVFAMVAMVALAGVLSGAMADPAAVQAEMMKAAKAKINTMEPATLMEWNKQKKDFVLLDVRTAGEVAAGKIEALNSKHITRGKLEFLAAKGAIKPEDTIVVYCKAGGRGALASATLVDMGFTDVYNLAGGIGGWMKAGFPITNSMGTFKVVPYELTGCAE